MAFNEGNVYLEKKRKKLVLPIFNRATYARCKALIEGIEKSGDLELTVLLSSGIVQDEFGNAKDYVVKNHPNVTFKILHLKNNDFTHLGITEFSADLLKTLAKHYHELKPDAVIVVADRFETLPAAMAAKYQNIKLIHIQGGEITGNIDDQVRWAVSQLADYHFVATKASKQYLLESGEELTRVFETGCPSLDLIKRNQIKRKKLSKRDKRYFICIFHPETDNEQEAYSQTQLVFDTCLDYARKTEHKCIWFYPNPDPGRNEIIKYLNENMGKNSAHIEKAINYEPEDFLRLLAKSQFIVGNSSCGIREGSYLGVPCINLGNRQSVRERSWNVVDLGFEFDPLFKEMESQAKIFDYRRSYLYGYGESTKYILAHLLRLELTPKPSKTYPKQFKFKELHFGEARFTEHKKRKRYEYGKKQGYEEKSMYRSD